MPSPPTVATQTNKGADKSQPPAASKVLLATVATQTIDKSQQPASSKVPPSTFETQIDVADISQSPAASKVPRTIDGADIPQPAASEVNPPTVVTQTNNKAEKPKSTASEVPPPTFVTQTIDRADISQPAAASKLAVATDGADVSETAASKVPPPTFVTQKIGGAESTTINPSPAVGVAILGIASPSDISTEKSIEAVNSTTEPTKKPATNSSSASASSTEKSIEVVNSTTEPTKKPATNSSSASASGFSAIDTPLAKPLSLAERMQSKTQSTLIDRENSIYELKMRAGKKFPSNLKIARRYIGRRTVGCVNEKVLMIVGATGAGKSTLINGIVNYLFGVQWDDAFRFKMIVEQAGTQINSITNTITAYTIYWQEGSPCNYTLTIIDTPGFGDTSGLKRDKEITKQIKEFFSISCDVGGIDHLDGIGFVTRASQARLTHTQRYVFDAILAIFGNDIASNIFMMITFADGKKPPVVDAIKASNIPYSKYFKFNNSALFPTVADKEEDDEGDFDELFWAMGMKSLKNFFKHFETAQPRSLQLTREVLEERQRLETNVNGLQPQINQGLAKMEEMRKERKIIKDHEADIETNKEFKYKIKLIKQRKVNTPAKHYVTNCLTYNRTCHKSCIYSNSEDKYQCSAMDGGGPSNASCTVCPGKCGWRKHVNNPYYFELYEQEEE